VPEQDTGGLEALVAELEAEIRERQTALAHLYKRLGRSPDESPVTGDGGALLPTSGGSASRDGLASGRVRSTEFFRMSIRQAIRRYLEIMKSPQSPKAMTDALKAGGLLTQSKDFYTTLWTQLKRMEKDGEVVNTPAGWGLADWYPSRPKMDDKKGKKKKKPVKRDSGDTTTGEKKPPSEYQRFLGVEMGQGKTMAQAAATWKEKKAAG